MTFSSNATAYRLGISVQHQIRAYQNSMNPIRLLVDSFADKDLPNAQMGNAREIIRRLNPAEFHVSVFTVGEQDAAIAQRSNTRLIRLPSHRQTPRIFRELVFGDHDILFYAKSSPATKWYMRLPRKFKRDRVSIGTVESQADLRNEPSIAPEAVRLWEQTVLRCDYLFSNSLSVQKSLSAEYGLRSEIVSTGVDTLFFQPALNRGPNLRPRVIFTGSLRPFKGPQIVLDAAARFPRADFVLAGTGPMGAELKDRVQREHLTNVQLLGLLKADDLRREYQNSDIFLFPSTWEGSPKVILEAAACGLPVIARKNYEPETVIDGETGYLAGDDVELYRRLEDLLQSPDLRKKFGRAGRRHAQRFDWDAITRRWGEIFLELTSRRRFRAAA